MDLTIKFFAKCREDFGEGLKISIDLNEVSVLELIEILEKDYNLQLKEDFENGKIIVSKDFEIVSSNDIINKNSEIGIYPPVSGG
ncbi:MoaD/ThiS family protein [Methanococcus maripaludis]|uniref:Molybdopterin synthase sulfur carrier subunit n=1 Tax=Methanococcus maripaludis TaxID=39152 RepID=A0A8T4H3G3_METMI|nr:MoaD/ThiS family protein [Methanococcus maripaludis]MBM7409397.1 molybdopterin synthase sulfur carrier subunit [Methanococcus maripaludis]MBP2219969.1 molybdopterin synthase sulfur carrier subunit [Methanococcus maripaludis]MDK2928569.1 sulfur-carrier protein [Methanococcus sp.]